MINTLNHQAPEQGKLRRGLASVLSFLQAMEATPFDHSFDRVERLEREVEGLKEELRRGRETALVDDPQVSAGGIES